MATNLSGSSTTIADIDIDALTHCASFLSLRDISNMAMSCKHLNRVAYSDSIWRSLYRQEWPHVVPLSPQACSAREAYLNRHTALHQFKYVDPLLSDLHVAGRPPHQLLFDNDTILFAQGSSVHSLQSDAFIGGGVSCTPRLRALHNARVNCMRLFSSSEAYLHQRESERYDNILITSSSDHFIRLWSKGGGSRCFKGHTGPVLTLSDKLLGHHTGKVFASGSEDGTVRLWSIYSSAKRGQQALKATLYGHEKAVSLLSVAGHKTSLLVSISKNGKVRVWDTTTASNSYRSTCCVGMAYLPFSPVDMKCNDSLIYVAAGSSVTAFDLRTMHKTFMVVQQEKVNSLELLPSRSILCTGGSSRAMLWDIRRVSNSFRVEPTVELDGHIGPVKHLYMDSYKIVTGGLLDQYVHVWETDTGKRTNSLICSEDLGLGCSAMAVDGCRIITSGDQDLENGIVRLRDFRTATCHVSSDPSEESSTFSKFWEPNLGSDSQED